MNNVQLVGRLTKDPDLRFTANKGTPVARFSVAVRNSIKNENGEYELKTRYLETPLGVINENHEYSLEIDEETGETYPVITGFIWKSYSNGAWKLIEQGKGVSMEISVKSGVYNKQRKIFEIIPNLFFNSFI